MTRRPQEGIEAFLAEVGGDAAPEPGETTMERPVPVPSDTDQEPTVLLVAGFAALLSLYGAHDGVRLVLNRPGDGPAQTVEVRAGVDVPFSRLCRKVSECPTLSPPPDALTVSLEEPSTVHLRTALEDGRLRAWLGVSGPRPVVERVEQLTGYLGALLDTVVAAPDRWLGDLDLVAPPPPAKQAAPGATVHDLVRARVEAHPDAVAVVGDGEHVTYGELWRSAVRVAHGLARMGVRPGDPVALRLPPAPGTVETILGTLLAGAWYVPIDPRHPGSRASFILRDSRSRLLIEEIPSAVTPDGPLPEVPASSPAYCLYTSGTTGQPKGVLISHANVVARISGPRFPFAFSRHDVWTQTHSCAFDMSVWEIFCCLATGGRLVVVPERDVQNPWALRETLLRERVTVLTQTPSAFARLVAVEDADPVPLPDLRYVLFGGERLDPPRLRDWRRRHRDVRLVNLYGITEATVHATVHEVTAEDCERDVSPIGRPLPDTSVHLVDPRTGRRLVPEGATGEMWLGGAGVATGYLRRPELDRERFVRGAFGEDVLLRTGDLARLGADGGLLYLRRVDDQFQWHGYRIEPGEIAARLREHPGVGDAAVLLEGGSEGRIAAYLVLSGAPPTPDELNTHLAVRLPPYMIPHVYAAVPGLPLTVNGKLDVQALAETATGLREVGADEAPVSATQRQIHLADRLLPGSYHETVAWRVAGRLDEGALRRAAAELTGRHEILRTRFRSGEHGPRQVVGEPWRPDVDVWDVRAREVSEGDVARWVAGAPPLDPATGRLLHLAVLRPAAGDDVLVLRQHHLVTDGGSVRILMRDLGRCYTAALADVTPSPWEGPQFRDVVAAELAGDDEAALARAERRLTGAPSTILRPSAHPCEEPVTVPLPPVRGEDLRAVGRRLRATPFAVVAGAVAAALHRWTGRDDVTFGVPAENRADPALAQAVGPCVNLLVLRSRTGPADTPDDLVTVLRDQLAEAVDDQHVPYERVVARLRPAQRLDAAPFCEVLLTFEADEADDTNDTDGPAELGGCPLTRMRFPEVRPHAAHPVMITVSATAGTITCRGGLLDEGDVARLARLVAEALDDLAHGRNASPAPEAPPEKLEEYVLGVWREVLREPRIGVDDNFFEVGGDSGLLTRVQVRLEDELGTEVPVTVFFACPTVRSLAARLAAEGDGHA
ncbi:non-ribosomal peptide synthetase [Streptosporangium saharense]|uniref:Amino acid adenylation domain-containing protein n=1 Tax=Streptosporangium saharense TaxID=1706840 RepID=A0A7W7QKS6_9ACTN|nr:non-ribosomal peptide synthetase [Streptosporangium saharense]MBB4915425.1 amino acid adenylation domain-containing protein [Streptosporangium saharense]